MCPFAITRSYKKGNSLGYNIKRIKNGNSIKHTGCIYMNVHVCINVCVWHKRAVAKV